MRPLGIAAAAAVALSALAAPPAPKPQGVTVTAAAKGTITDLRVSGWSVATALPRVAGAGREIVILAKVEPSVPRAAKKATEPCAPSADKGRSADDDAPRRLLRWSPAAPSVLAVLRDDVDPAIAALDAVDLDGDGSDEILLFRPGAVEVLARGADGAFSGVPRPLLSDSALEVTERARLFRSPLYEAETLLRYSVPGSFRTYGPVEDGGRWGLRSSVPVPTEASAYSETLVVTNRAVAPVGRRADGTLVLATVPEQVGKERIRLWRLEPDAPGGPVAVECWCALPGQEQLVDWGYDILDGRPVLIATTTRADKMSLLGEKKIRVFPMEPDRTRRGARPIAAFESNLNLWQVTDPFFRDVDGDGASDLVLPHWKGLQNDIAAVSVHPGRPDGTISPKASTQSFEVDKGDRAFIEYGADFDADGNPELLLFGDGALRVFSGVPAARRPKALVAEKPAWSFPLPKDVAIGGSAGAGFGPDGIVSWRNAGPMGSPVALDLDGSGGVELVLAGNTTSGQGCVLVFGAGNGR